MKNKIFKVLAAAILLSSCTSTNDTLNQKAITPLSNGLIELSKANSLLTETGSNTILINYVDSIASTISLNNTYESNLLKIYEMEYSIANGIAYTWANTAVKKYLTSDNTVVLTNNSTGKDENSFRHAIIQSLLTANESLNYCNKQEDFDLQSLNKLAFNVLNAYNTFFFCYYFVTDNQDYLTFFSNNSQTINSLQSYSDALFTCGQLSDNDAFKLASTLESTAFLITMSTLSFNMLWNNYEEETQKCADFFNKYSETTIKALSENDFEECTILSSEKDYLEYLTKAANYKKQIMELVIDGFKHQDNN